MPLYFDYFSDGSTFLHTLDSFLFFALVYYILCRAARKLPWWTKIQDSNPTAFLDVYSLGPEVTPLEAYALQELVLIPLSFKVYRGIDPAARAEMIRSGGVEASYAPMEHRPPGKEVVAKAVTALAFLEKRFGARTLKAGLRLGMVRVAGFEVRLSTVETVQR